MKNNREIEFCRGICVWLLACSTVWMAEPAFVQQISDVIFVQGFEEGNLGPGATIETKGEFTEQPGIKTAALFESAHALGFGKTACTANCWNDYTSTLRIEFPEPQYFGLVEFKEAELDGNYGSTGYVLVDGHMILDGIFQKYAWNDGIADTTVDTVVLSANRIGRVLEFVVIDITGTSELFIDDIVVTAYKRHSDTWTLTNFNDMTLDPSISIRKKGTYTLEPGFRTLDRFGPGPVFGFGKSTVSVNALDNYVTTLEMQLPDPIFIEAVSFLESEADSNWGSQGLVLIDDHVLPYSTFGRLPSNDAGLDSTIRWHYIPVNQRGSRIALKVSDITDKSEIIIDDLLFMFHEPAGVPFLIENFEDGVLAPEMSIWQDGTFAQAPGVKDAAGLEGAKAFGFGKSTCSSGCWDDYISSITIQFPEPMPVEALSFLAMEQGVNWGCSGQLRVNHELWPSVDFARSPSNDAKSDTSARVYHFLLGFPVQRIEWTVWDVADASEVFIDDIGVFGPGTGVARDGGPVPARFEVFQNVPNPFNATTVITYEISESSPVTLTVYNAQGQVVDRRDLGEKKAGMHQEVWNKPESATGTYFCEISTPSSSRVLKMTLVQ
jgi:hypothetical protein